MIYFAGWKAHYSLYPVNEHLVAEFGDRLAAYEVNGKGTIRFRTASRRRRRTSGASLAACTASRYGPYSVDARAVRIADAAGPHRRQDAPLHVRIDDLMSSRDAPGFQILFDDPPYEVAVGAIGKVWRPTIPFVHIDGAEAFANFNERGFINVAWAIRVVPRSRESMSAGGCRVEVEVRMRATDPVSWRLFKRYFYIIGPASHLIRRTALTQLAREAEFAERRPTDRGASGGDHRDGRPAEVGW